MKKGQENLDYKERTKSMLEATKAGKYVAPNRIGGTPKHDFAKIPDDTTVYASK